MQTTDVIIVAQRHASCIDNAIREFAKAADDKTWTEASVSWGKIVTHALALANLEHMGRQILFEQLPQPPEPHETTATNAE